MITIDLEKVYSPIWEQITAERDGRKSGGVEVAGFWFHTDPDSRIQFLGLKDTARDQLANGDARDAPLILGGQPIIWKTMVKDANGEAIYVPLTIQFAIDIVEAVKALDAINFVVAEQHRAAMEAAEDPTKYDFSGNWAPTFAEAS